MIKKYWRYYLILESEFIKSADFVEIHKNNFNTFSIRYAFLIQSVGAELDILFKELCQFKTSDRKTITDYAKEILSKDKFNIKNLVIEVMKYDIKLQPFKNWEEKRASQSLNWWEAFTSIKHNRYENIKKANLENVLNILGALFLIEHMLLKKVKEKEDLDIFDDPSKVFDLPKGWTNFVNARNGLFLKICEN